MYPAEVIMTLVHRSTLLRPLKCILSWLW